jgi:hypothetical protein
MSSLEQARSAIRAQLDHEWVADDTGIFVRAEHLRLLLGATDGGGSYRYGVVVSEPDEDLEVHFSFSAWHWEPYTEDEARRAQAEFGVGSRIARYWVPEPGPTELIE